MGESSLPHWIGVSRANCHYSDLRFSTFCFLPSTLNFLGPKAQKIGVAVTRLNRRSRCMSIRCFIPKLGSNNSLPVYASQANTNYCRLTPLDLNQEKKFPTTDLQGHLQGHESQPPKIYRVMIFRLQGHLQGHIENPWKITGSRNQFTGPSDAIYRVMVADGNCSRLQ